MMISVLVLGYPVSSHRPATPGDAVRTLAALVPGTVEGLVRDVCLLGPEDDTELSKIADHAGCGLVAAPRFAAAVKAGARQARCPLLLVLQSGVAFDRAFTEELASAAQTLSETRRARGYDLKTFESGLSRFFPRWAADAGLLTSRESVEATEPQNFAALVRACRPLRSFKTRAWIGG